jgi:hypothetical protein
MHLSEVPNDSISEEFHSSTFCIRANMWFPFAIDLSGYSHRLMNTGAIICIMWYRRRMMEIWRFDCACGRWDRYVPKIVSQSFVFRDGRTINLHHGCWKGWASRLDGDCLVDASRGGSINSKPIANKAKVSNDWPIWEKIWVHSFVLPNL